MDPSLCTRSHLTCSSGGWDDNPNPSGLVGGSPPAAGIGTNRGSPIVIPPIPTCSPAAMRSALNHKRPDGIQAARDGRLSIYAMA